MYVDCNIGGGIDGTGGADFGVLAEQIAHAQRTGFDGLWSTEVNRDPFLPLAVAAQAAPSMQIGTAVAVAFARSPMTMAAVANDLNTLSHGRFVLGLGSQIQAHIERRFSMPWSAPAQRMREYIQALHAIWGSWQSGEQLDFRGEHYRHTLMTPMFSPEPSAFGKPRIVLAAVGPKMTAVAAELADGLLVHGFTTARYLADVTQPLIEAGLRATGRERADFSVCYPGLIVTAADERSYAVALQQVRRQIAFYGATPAYRAVLDIHGWGELHTELHRLSKVGDWTTMSTLIDDEVLSTFAVCGEPADIGAEIVRRFRGLVDRFTVYTPYPLDEAARAAVVEGIKRADQA
ncbi:putative F420-dependent oxidoreductase [Mycolicibacterium sp. BK556]|uniref:TIGR03617 family F420-dependent LLM class oxidoreductase n=1 Tax=unclassified Mycolicibacterium TaxID=2636767 RepID=UPI001615D72D|nr:MULTISPECIES: TIGR03617 family F420-dependent LLM class oxidoreductase [unclassified Mycolicibacterium]MBB3605971.1 putative F420-dependent oxidoreductase [Mycolicibacterium sp. BK556]MBB3632548.1 putative F420-dependent oxidoreductase [Mycolicibacterium sp. BK607]